MSPNATEKEQLKKTEKRKSQLEPRHKNSGLTSRQIIEKEKIRKVYYVPNSKLREKLKESLKEQPPGRIESQ